MKNSFILNALKILNISTVFLLFLFIGDLEAQAHTKCRVTFFGGWTEGCPHSHGGVIDNTPLDPDTWNPVDWARSGAGEACETNGRITAERNRDRDQGLSSIQKDYLRPDFGDLVDEVTVIWGALLNDHITFQGRTLLLGSAGQTYGNTIYIAEQRRPRSTYQLTLLAHEFKHVQQYRSYGDLDTFCREYVRGLWGNGYDLNPLEVEAYHFDYSFAQNLRKRLLPFSPSTSLYDHPTPNWNRRHRIELPTYLPDMVWAQPSIAGRWNSSEGIMNFQQEGSSVTSTYNTQENGIVEGNLSSNILTGYWIEDSSARRCNTSRRDRYYWGRIRLVFDGSSFRGLWGYCDDEPNQNWAGSR